MRLFFNEKIPAVRSVRVNVCKEANNVKVMLMNLKKSKKIKVESFVKHFLCCRPNYEITKAIF